MIKFEVRKGAYYDSITLMLAAREVGKIKGVTEAFTVMATESNLEILKASGLYVPEMAGCSGSDLLVVVKGDGDDVCSAAVAQTFVLLDKQTKKQGVSETRPATIGGALKINKNANLELISVAGRYAHYEAGLALENNLHVMMFSDNVSVEEEVRLKKTAHEKGLLLMGPDCGTAIINNIPLAFANVVNKGGIGIVAASGTGLQEVSTLIHKFGGGISQAIGTGGRDLKKVVGGQIMIDSLHALMRDPGTSVIVLVSKPPDKEVADKILKEAALSNKPVVVHFISGDPGAIVRKNLIAASSLSDTARLAVMIEKGSLGEVSSAGPASIKANLKTGQKYIRGLYSGGTLCDEGIFIAKKFTDEIFTNISKEGLKKISGFAKGQLHTFIDMGEDEFTQGRPHPMIDYSLRTKRMLEEAADPEVAVILFDVVLGYGSNMDPAGELAPAIKKGRELAAKEGREIIYIGYICGTDLDPQGYVNQAKTLEDCGVILPLSHKDAIILALSVIGCSANAPDDSLDLAALGYFRKNKPVSTAPTGIDRLFGSNLSVVNAGIKSFAENVKMAGGEVIDLSWKPPAGGNEEIIALLSRIKGL